MQGHEECNGERYAAVRAAEDAGRRAVAGLWAHRPGGRHGHTPVRNVNEAFDQRLTAGQRIADIFASAVGSWPFIITQSILLATWIALNVTAVIRHWDPYPFILLNLALSFQAAYAAPIIMMSQNRQAAKDRVAAEVDYEVNRTAEDEVRAVLDRLAHQEELILHILRQLETADDRHGQSSGEGSRT